MSTLTFCSSYNNLGTKNQIAAILSSKAKEIAVETVGVQLQSGGSDCGLFAIAFATALVNDQQPEKSLFNQTKMRSHLHHCLTTGILTVFPAEERQLKRRCRKGSVDTIKIFCSCRMPEMEPMVECTGCKEWYHTACVSVPERALEDQNMKWFCNSCQ